MAYNNNTDVARLSAVWLGADPDKISNVNSVTSASSKEDILFYWVCAQSRKATIALRNWPFAVREIQLNLARGTSQANYNSVTITGVTTADPAVVTAPGHNFNNNWTVRLSDIGGMNNLNGKVVRVTAANANAFTAYQVDATKMGTYTSGGNAIRYETLTDYQDGYVYEAPDDLMSTIATIPANSQFELVGTAESKRILSPESDLALQYKADHSNVADMPNDFIRCWAAKMAYELASPLQKRGSVRPDMYNHYEIVLKESGLTSARNSNPLHLIRDGSFSFDAGGWS